MLGFGVDPRQRTVDTKGSTVEPATALMHDWMQATTRAMYFQIWLQLSIRLPEGALGSRFRISSYKEMFSSNDLSKEPSPDRTQCSII